MFRLICFGVRISQTPIKTKKAGLKKVINIIAQTDNSFTTDTLND